MVLLFRGSFSFKPEGIDDFTYRFSEKEKRQVLVIGRQNHNSDLTYTLNP